MHALCVAKGYLLRVCKENGIFYFYSFYSAYFNFGKANLADGPGHTTSMCPGHMGTHGHSGMSSEGTLLNNLALPFLPGPGKYRLAAFVHHPVAMFRVFLQDMHCDYRNVEVDSRSACAAGKRL